MSYKTPHDPIQELRAQITELRNSAEGFRIQTTPAEEVADFVNELPWEAPTASKLSMVDNQADLEQLREEANTQCVAWRAMTESQDLSVPR
jgi:uncharacterized coiled-coil DUF342 family protein